MQKGEESTWYTNIANAVLVLGRVQNRPGQIYASAVERRGKGFKDITDAHLLHLILTAEAWTILAVKPTLALDS